LRAAVLDGMAVERFLKHCGAAPSCP
jgi:hypothetical protein